jgi:hypothetical protein
MVLQPHIMHGFNRLKLSERKTMKGNIKEKNITETKKADLMDWLLAIDASLP